MGEARRAAEAVTSALEARDYETARQWLADDFVFDDPFSPQPPMTAEQWLGANRSLHDAFEDFSFNFRILDEEDDRVWVEARMSGTHTGDWDLSQMGAGVIPATGIHVETSPSVTCGYIDADGRAARIEVVEQTEDSGMLGILRRLGIQIG